MTLIAGLAFENVPMLIGDLLVHSQHPSEHHIELPSVGDSREVIEPGWGLSVALRQKIFLVNRFTAVAWSGSYIAATEVLSEFQVLAGDQRLCSARRQDFFQGVLSAPAYHDIALIGMTALSGSEFDFFGYNVRKQQNERFDPCICAGSGSIDFPSTAQLGPPMMLEGPPAERAISAAHVLIGAFLAREINARSPATDTTPNPLLDLYGGGWELASVGDGSVYKLGNTASFFWNLDERDDGTFELRAPSLIVKTDYAGAFLVRRWLRGHGSPHWSAPWLEQRCTVTRPILGGGSSIDVSDPRTWPPLAAQFQVHVVLVTPSKGRRHVTVWTSWLGPQAVSTYVRFAERIDDRSTAVDVQPQAFQMIISAIPSMRARLSKSNEL